MKTTLRIARLELGILFYSPIAWLMLAIFVIQSGLTYIDLVERMEKAQALGQLSYGLTDSIFASTFRGFFKTVQSNIYLYLPLLTMGLISRELSSGSIKLLFSSPIKVTSIILGKYLAMMGYGLMLTGILGIFVGIGYFSVESLDVTLVLSGLLGLYLLICAYAAIGLFMSCLTSYQVVAAISTLVVFAALNYVKEIGKEYDFVRDLTYFLSIAGRTDEFIVGLISSEDVLYFLIIIMMFLGFAILRLQGGRESKPLFVKAGRYIVLFVVVLMIGYITSRPSLILYYDSTANKRQTLTENSQKIVEKINGPLKVTAYVNLIDPIASSFMPFNKTNDQNVFEQYIRFLPQMQLDYVYYYDTLPGSTLYNDNPGLTDAQLAKKVETVWQLDEKQVLTPAEIRKRIDLSGEGNRIVRVVEYSGKKIFLRMYEDLFRQPQEREISAVLKQLEKGPIKVAVLAGNNERSIEKMGDAEYKILFREKTFRNALINQGFDVDTIILSNGNPLPTAISLLVIADPKQSLPQPELDQLKKYIEEGGNLFILGEPGRQPILNPLTELLGVTLGNQIVNPHNGDFAPDFIVADLQTPSKETIEKLDPLYKLNAQVSMSGVSEVQYTDKNGFHVFPLLTTHTPDNPAKTVPLVVGVTRQYKGKQQRIVISGDADFIGNSELLRKNPSVQNFSFANELFRWFSYDEYPIETTRPKNLDNKLLLTASDVSWLRIIILGVLPVILICSGGLLLLIRKRR